MAEPSPSPHGLVLSADEFEAALALLVEEERRGTQHYARQLIFNLAFSLTLVVALFACPLGTLIRFIDPRLGQPLLVTGLVAAAGFALLGTFKRDGLLLSSDDIRAAAGLDKAPLDESVEAGWRKRTRGTNLIIGLLLIPGALSVLGGLAWLLYGLFVQRVTPVLSLVLMAWPLLGLFAMTAIRAYQEYVYFSRVAHLRRSFTARFVAAKRDEQAQVSLSAEEVSEFAQVQHRNLAANVRASVQQYAKSGQELYAIVIELEAQAALRDLPAEAQTAVRDRLDQLQEQPRPAEARPTADGSALSLLEGGHTLTYQVDEARRRVTLLSLAAAQEATHGA